MSNRKRTFLDAANPASMFMSNPQPTETQPQQKPLADTPASKREPGQPLKAPEGFKLNPVYVETKSKRVQLLMQPSLLEAAKAEAAAQGISLNEFISNILRNTLNGD